MRLNLRFQPWLMGWTLLLVVLLSATFLFSMFRTFSAVAEERAVTRFDLIARQIWSELDHLVQHSSRFVAAQAEAEPRLFADADGRLNGHDMIHPFVASIMADDNIYSHFFALANEEFLQVVAIRSDDRLAATLQAPPGSAYAVRQIRGLLSQPRREVWRFYDTRRQLLGERQQTAKLIPSSRPWYAAALASEQTILTPPYLFASNGELGLTVARALPDRMGVLATDINLRALATLIRSFPLPANGAIAIQDEQGRLLAFHGQGPAFADLVLAPLTPVSDIRHPWLGLLATGSRELSSQLIPASAGQPELIVARHRSQAVGGRAFDIVVLAPLSDFFGAFEEAERNIVQLALLLLAILLPLVWLGSRPISRVLRGLARNSERLKRLDFTAHSPPEPTFLYEINTLGEAQHVMHGAIRERTEALLLAQRKLARLVETGLELSREADRDVLLRHTLFGAREIAQCAAATLFLKTEHNTLSFALRTSDDPLPLAEIPLFDSAGQPNEKYVVVYAAHHNETVIIDDVYRETRFDLSGTRRLNEESGFRTVSMLTVPLSPRQGEVIGLLQLLNATDPASGAVIPFDPELIGFVEALAAQAAIALENKNLIEAQKNLLDAMIKLVAGAIDAKSPYTGGHCERVPELALMLAREACAVDHGPLADFRFTSDDEWREFRIGAWLHDCGKVTTPEFVVDKATKLETIHNRIHEIRTRFEVLLRDADIARLRAIHEDGVDRTTAEARFAARRAQLADDFAFIASCNLGSEFMAPAQVERIRQLAGETWLRHFDDRLGLSEAELRRYPPADGTPLPVREHLLADQPWHRLPRQDDHPALAAGHGWQMAIPENLYNFGEVYNLCIRRGTLTEEERFKINEHIIQTIVMLEQLPLPKGMRRIPEYAGTHHETMIGTGYPRRLAADQLSIPSRIMAIADIFEALTASDRPYKPMKTLSECIRILFLFKKDRHIDPVLFDLFLSSGVYLRYAERFLKPEQIDAVDIAPYLGPCVDAPRDGT